MNNENWKEITISTTFKACEIITEFLEEIGIQGITFDREQEQNNAFLKGYFLESELDEAQVINNINNKLDSIKNSGIDIGKKEVIINEVKESDWANDWKQYFEPFRAGKHLVIKPFWLEDFSSQTDDVVINFDPGGFFGSTPHPSTRLCLEEIEELVETSKIQSNSNILDLGSGSGILSLALYSLGIKKITAIDIDPVAIRSSEDNFKINNMDIELFLGDLKDCNDTYDFIAGNLLAETIIELSEQLSEKLNKNGIFIGAGVTRIQEESVINALEKVNIFVENKRYKDEWVLIRGIKR